MRRTFLLKMKLRKNLRRPFLSNNETKRNMWQKIITEGDRDQSENRLLLRTSWRCKLFNDIVTFSLRRPAVILLLTATYSIKNSEYPSSSIRTKKPPLRSPLNYVSANWTFSQLQKFAVCIRTCLLQPLRAFSARSRIAFSFRQTAATIASNSACVSTWLRVNTSDTVFLTSVEASFQFNLASLTTNFGYKSATFAKSFARNCILRFSSSSG